MPPYRSTNDHVIIGGALGCDATWLLKRVPKEIDMSALPRALCVVLRQHARATLVSLAASLGLTTPTLPP
jgi:hypothetical protein